MASALAIGAVKPNFILLLADDMGWGDVGYNNVSSRIHNPGAGGVKYDVNPPRTPNIDAMAFGANSMLFHRYYSGSAVCSPTRASSLTGRTSDRDCIGGAEGCGQEPAWKCANNLPLSPRTFTLAKAAKSKGYATTHIGKWHLGNFFPKPKYSKHNFANDKWPVSSPRVHGFDEWHSTEASASSSLCNCGCDPAWATSPAGDAGAVQGIGCITGGGNFTTTPYDCTNYWSPTDLDAHHLPLNSKCASANMSTLNGCVANMTEKITGNDNVLIMDLFEDFLKRKAPGGSEESPFFAAIWTHTNHEPHPAMPEWYHAYADVYGEPAGDYLGTISQMDQQIGRLRTMLKTYGVAENTALWFTADNGPHTANGGGCSGPHARSSDQATNGLRQCKASLFEGGIRVPGILEWPAVIKSHRETLFPAYVSDYLPTFLDAIGMAHPNPSWYADGISLMPLLEQAAAQDVSTALVAVNRSKPLGFALGSQRAWIDNEWKVVEKAQKGQCKTMLPPYKSGQGTYLFNLVDDPTESHDVSAANPERFAAMVAALDAWSNTIVVSQETESQCVPDSPSPAPVGPVGPTPPASGSFLKVGTQCLTLTNLASHSKPVLGACDAGSKWTVSNGATIANVNVQGVVLKIDGEVAGFTCKAGNQVWLGKDKPALDVVAVVTGSTLIIKPKKNCVLCVGSARGTFFELSSCESAAEFTIV
jgi:arylsulfatase A-like enzyme